MYKDSLWNEFLKTGKVEKYIEFKKEEMLEKEGELTEEANKGKGDSNTRNSI